MTYELNLPESVKRKAERSPVEDIIQYLVNHELPEVPFGTWIPADLRPGFFAIVRGDNPLNFRVGNSKFVFTCSFKIETYTKDPNGDEAGNVLSEAIRVALRDCCQPTPVIVPGRGHPVHINSIVLPNRKKDWETPIGAIEFADVPAGYQRYETEYEMQFRIRPGQPFLDF